MKKTQIITPTIILIIIFISSLLLIVEMNLKDILLSSKAQLSTIEEIINNLNNKDLNYQINLTNQVLNLAKMGTSSGTMMNVLNKKGEINMLIDNVIIVSYNKSYSFKNLTKSISNILLINYPYGDFKIIESNIRNCIINLKCNIQSRQCIEDESVFPFDLSYSFTNCSGDVKAFIVIKNENYPLTNNYAFEFNISSS